jgi:hypothetical protein
MGHETRRIRSYTVRGDGKDGRSPNGSQSAPDEPILCAGAAKGGRPDGAVITKQEAEYSRKIRKAVVSELPEGST